MERPAQHKWHLATAPLRDYANFSGRASRTEFWLFYLLVFAVFALMALAGLAFGLEFSRTGSLNFTLETDAMPTAASIGFYIAFLGWLIVTMLPLLCVAARRLHDLGLSGHFLWPYVLVGSGEPWMLAVNTPYFVAFAWPGQKGNNDWGAPPRELLENELATV